MKNLLKKITLYTTFSIGLIEILINTGCFVSKRNLSSEYASFIYNSSKILDSAKNEVKTPAISIAVGVDNEIIWAKAIGYKDPEKAELADINTKFRVGSSSKAITSVAIGKLIVNRRLNLDSSIRYYVPFFVQPKQLSPLGNWLHIPLAFVII